MTTSGTNYHAQALARGLQILRHLAASRKPRTLTELHTEMALPKPTLVRLLSVMEGMSFVVRVDERPSFKLGHSVVELAEAYLEAADVAALARPHLHKLAETTGHTANLGILDGSEVVHLCVEEPDRPIRFNAVTGSRASAYCTGLGKLLLSCLPESAVADHLPPPPFDRLTDKTIVTLEDLRADLERIGERGYSYDDEESNAGVRCLAVRLAVEGRDLGAISVAGPAAELAPGHHEDVLSVLRSSAEHMASDGELVAALRLLPPNGPRGANG